MIALPPSFDVSQFVGDILTATSPFISIAFLFLVYRVIKRLGRGL